MAQLARDERLEQDPLPKPSTAGALIPPFHVWLPLNEIGFLPTWHSRRRYVVRRGNDGSVSRGPSPNSLLTSLDAIIKEHRPRSSLTGCLMSINGTGPTERVRRIEYQWYNAIFSPFVSPGCNIKLPVWICLPFIAQGTLNTKIRDAAATNANGKRPDYVDPSLERHPYI
jgi:hypothetical protein